jgi:hypothetical protein
VENLLTILVALLFFYWMIRGLFGLFQRYHLLLVVTYLVFLSPIALIHAFFLGIFGMSKEQLLRHEAAEEAKRQMLIEEERKKLDP